MRRYSKAMLRLHVVPRQYGGGCSERPGCDLGSSHGSESFEAEGRAHQKRRRYLWANLTISGHSEIRQESDSPGSEAPLIVRHGGS